MNLGILNILRGAKTIMTERQFLEAEIKKFKSSQKRKDMLAGELYYAGTHDILKRTRTVIGDDGLLVEVENLPNNKIVDNQYAKMVDQKKNYLVGKPISFETDNKTYGALLKDIFNNKFQRTIKNIGEDALNEGIGYIYPYYNDKSKFEFKIFKSYEMLIFWKDEEHTEIDVAVRIYPIEAYEGAREVIIEKVEVYNTNGIERYELKDGKLIDDVETPSTSYVTVTNAENKTEYLNWDKVPVIAFKYNNKEIPLINRVKSLQDGINIILSDFENNMQEDARNTILVLQNYDGTNLGEFRRNLAQYGAVKVKTIDGSAGAVTTLTVTVDSDNYKAILELFKKALIENARGYDAKDDRMSGNPNQMNIQSMYSDIDLDANDMETEFQASIEELLWFINAHLANNGKGDFEHETVNIIFNRDILINESEAITNCTNSVGVISDETIISQHPWVDDIEKELKRKEEQKKKEVEEANEYANAFNATGGDPVNEE